MIFFSTDFWNYSIERAIKTLAQAAIAAIGTGSIGLLAIDWVNVLSLSGGAALLSLLTSIVTQGRRKSENAEE